MQTIKYKHPFRFIAATLIVLFTNFSLLSCKKFSEVPGPNDEVLAEHMFDGEAEATGAVTGIYSEMMKTPLLFSNSGTTIYAGMSADELRYFFPGFRDEFVNNQITQTSHNLISALFWGPAYRLIYIANACLEGLNKSTSIPAPIKSALMGECYFSRALCYFILVNIFGDVPLVLTTDYHITSTLGREAVTKVYQQITDDLLQAQNDLPETYDTLFGGMGRIRPNKWAATALLARVYLYNQEWNKAELNASAVINSTTYSLPANPADVFSDSSAEAIWQLHPVRPDVNTWEGNILLPPDGNTPPGYLVTDHLFQAFENADLRKQTWIGEKIFNSTRYHYPAKYKVRNGSTVTEYYVILRLAEQYLIRAEARAQQNKLSESAQDINAIRHRANLANTAASTQEELLTAIENERRTELFAEWGHRWFDLKRTNRINTVLGVLKPTWQATDALWPIPIDQLRLNVDLHQNPGY